jgi:pteridine reductase
MKAILITGAARRLGLGIAQGLAKAGYHIALHYHTSENLTARASRSLRNLGVRCELFPCDLADEEAVQQLIPRVRKVFPGLCGLVNNASLFIRSDVKTTGGGLLDQLWKVNLKAPFLLSTSFSQECKRGSIINILDAKIGKQVFNYAAYYVTKSGLAAFTKLAARELGPRIRVNAVAPGPILAPPGEDAGYLKTLAGRTPLRRRGKVTDISQAVVFLMTNQYVTGQILYVDGGQHL